MALVMVIWVLAFLGIALSAFAFSMRTELDAARTFKEEAEAASLARAGIARGLAEAVNAGASTGGGPSAWAPYDSGDVPLGRGAYRVVVSPQSRIALNHAPAEVLNRLLEVTGVTDPGLRETIVDSILDWRDSDSLHRLRGAEEDYYQSLPHPYHPRNGNFEHLEELLLVKGMTRQILYGNIADPGRLASLRAASPADRDLQPGELVGIHPFLTVLDPGQSNAATGSMAALRALGLLPPGATGRLRALEMGTEGRGFSAAMQLNVIESVASLAGSPVTYRITAVVRGETIRGTPRFRVIAWSEG